VRSIAARLIASTMTGETFSVVPTAFIINSLASRA
jgi:hypothetical protein